MEDLIFAINSFSWIAGNVLVAYITFAIVAFVIAYYFLFDPKSTTAGQLILRFMFSLVGVVGLIFVGTYVNPAPDRSWDSLPEDIVTWRPLIRFAIYGYVTYTVTSLGVLLWVRKFRPWRLKTAPGADLVKLRHTKDGSTVD